MKSKKVHSRIYTVEHSQLGYRTAGEPRPSPPSAAGRRPAGRAKWCKTPKQDKQGDARAASRDCGESETRARELELKQTTPQVSFLYSIDLILGSPIFCFVFIPSCHDQRDDPTTCRILNYKHHPPTSLPPRLPAS